MSDRPRVTKTSIPGLLKIELELYGDNRGWFKENYQKAKMEAAGLPKFEVIQNNISFNQDLGTTRGLHAEPWDKFVSVANGRVFAAWVDVRKGPSFGTTYTAKIDPQIAFFIPHGLANGYQTLESNVAYTYLVNEHWSPDAKYTFVNLFDPELKIEWPITKQKAIISQKDAGHPPLNQVKPMDIH